MIRRPLNSRFSDSVLRDQKTTTIRDKPWPLAVPIMLFNWSGVAYRSKQVDVAVVIVYEVSEIRITRDLHRMSYLYIPGLETKKALYQTEGFATLAEMNAWFRPLVKPGQTVTKYLMRFHRI